VVELGCGLGVPSIVAARAGATVLAMDSCSEALTLVRRNARENKVAVDNATVDWEKPEWLLKRAPFDLVLAADILYELASVARRCYRSYLGWRPRCGSRIPVGLPPARSSSGRPAGGLSTRASAVSCESTGCS
jgi:predicted nicotinamide N-methyase